MPSERERSRYRQLVEAPCRVQYRYDGKYVIILSTMRTEQLLRLSQIEASDTT